MALSATEEIDSVIASYLQNCEIGTEGITASQLQTIYHKLRPGNSVSLAQVKAAVETVCFCDLCLKDEVLDVLAEIDRRSFLMRDLEWEFAMLDRENCGTIAEKDAIFLLKALHGKTATRKCSTFLENRLLPGSRVTLQEIELYLCDKTKVELSDEDDDVTRHDHETESERMHTTV